MGLAETGSGCFERAWVTGYSRVPAPPASIMPLRGTGALAIVECDPVAICITGDIRNPFLIFEVPTDRLAQAALERFLRLPTKLAFDLVRINSLAPTVAGPVPHESDLLPIGFVVAARLALVQDVTDEMHHLKVRLLVRRANIVGLARPASLQHAPDCSAVVRNIEPVTNVLAVAVDRQRFSGESAANDKRDQFLRELIRAVIVGAIGGEDRQSIGAVIGSHKMIRRSLARRVWTVRRIGGGFPERGITDLKTAINLVGRNVKKPKLVPFARGEGAPMGMDSFEESQGSHNIGLDKCVWVMNRPVDMTFGREVDYGCRPGFSQNVRNRFDTADVRTAKGVSMIIGKLRKILYISGVSQAIDIDHRVRCGAYPVMNKI